MIRTSLPMMRGFQGSGPAARVMLNIYVKVRGYAVTNEDTHIAVLMGGLSAERPVSLSSGKACAAALRERGFKVTEVDVGRDVAQVLADLKPDVAFNALHGPLGRWHDTRRS